MRQNERNRNRNTYIYAAPRHYSKPSALSMHLEFWLCRCQLRAQHIHFSRMSVAKDFSVVSRNGSETMSAICVSTHGSKKLSLTPIKKSALLSIQMGRECLRRVSCVQERTRHITSATLLLKLYAIIA